jgi:hypothetical protein
MAGVGLLETRMTAGLVDDLTDTGSNKHRESVGQGIANLIDTPKWTRRCPVTCHTATAASRWPARSTPNWPGTK